MQNTASSVQFQLFNDDFIEIHFVTEQCEIARNVPILQAS